MRKKWVVCMIACLMILFAGCNGNTAKETARNDTDKRISFTAGNTETTNGTEKERIQVLFLKRSNQYQVKQQQSQVSRKSRMFLLRQVVGRKLQKAMNPFR